MAAQLPLKEKIELADFVIDNDGAKSKTRNQVKKVWRMIVWK
jgi:dephospho-CoA kinase